MNSLGDIDERSTRPNSGIECTELVVGIWHNSAEPLLHQFWIFFESCIHIEENDTLFFKIFTDAVVNRFRFVLCGHSRQPLLFCLRDTQAVKRVANIFGNILPVFLSLVTGAKEIGNCIKVDFFENRHIAPCWHRSISEVMVGLDTNLSHPFWFILEF
ncbi:MAG: Uncharacterised protein [Marine Group II euryarchaeote MED-G33]|nr:MAG: Uncharacterised protein [Marine Group II euryarchaeote MED-G33]